MSAFSRPGVVAALACLLCPSLAPAAIVYSSLMYASSTAEFHFNGTPYEAGQAIQDPFFASSQALAGVPGGRPHGTPEARTAARVGATEFAANARLDGKDFFFDTDIETNQSAAQFEIVLYNAGSHPERVLAEFFLPASYVETTNNAEIPFATVDTSITAIIETDLDDSPSFSLGLHQQHFFAQAGLESSYLNEDHSTTALGQSGLDLSPLLNATLVDSGSGFLRTRTLELPDYSGSLDLGLLEPGQFLRFRYTLHARADGSAAFSVGIAAINDPFLVDADPVFERAPVTFQFVPVSQATVPEPGSLLLLSGAALATLGLRRVARRAP